MQELIVILACLSAKGCSESRGAYFKYNPHVAQELQVQENVVRHAVGPFVVNIVSPVIKVAADKEFNLKIDKYNLNVSSDKVAIGYVEEW